VTIKETAGKILLYFYKLQRVAPASIRLRRLAFVDKKNDKMDVMSDEKWLSKDLTDINSSASDIYNAFMFLVDGGFIKTRERMNSNPDNRIFVGIHLTHAGFYVIESIEGSPEGKIDFWRAFNILVAEGASVDDVIDDNLSTLLG